MSALLERLERHHKCPRRGAERRNDPRCVRRAGGTVDAAVAAWAARAAAWAAARRKPFFLAAGLRRPHIPWEAPRADYETALAAQRRLNRSASAFPADAPAVAWSDNWSRVAKGAHWDGDRDCPSPRLRLPASFARKFRAAYAASAHAADAVLGDVVRAAEHASTERGLLVVATADHGFHLGDHGAWSKQTLFDASLRVPLVISGAGVAPGVVDAPAETTGIFATVSALAGLPGLPATASAARLPGPGDAAWRVARAFYERRCDDVDTFESQRHAACRRSPASWAAGPRLCVIRLGKRGRRRRRPSSRSARAGRRTSPGGPSAPRAPAASPFAAIFRGARRRRAGATRSTRRTRASSSARSSTGTTPRPATATRPWRAKGRTSRRTGRRGAAASTARLSGSSALGLGVCRSNVTAPYMRSQTLPPADWGVFRLTS